MVSSRDQYLVIYRKDIPAELSSSGRKTCIVSCKSVDLPEYPLVPGCVRAQTFISGYFIEEINENECEVHFVVESDFKISLFISKQVAPKSSNYSNALREYVDKVNAEENWIELVNFKNLKLNLNFNIKWIKQMFVIVSMFYTKSLL